MPKKSPQERQLLISVVEPVIEAAGGRQRVVKLTGAANSTVGRWLEGDIGFDGLLRLASSTRTDIVLTFPGHGRPTGKTKERPPAWAEGLEGRIANEVISALASPERLRALELLAEQSAGTPPPSDVSHDVDVSPQGQDE